VLGKSGTASVVPDFLYDVNRDHDVKRRLNVVFSARLALPTNKHVDF
jgi:hypothetical protein